MSEDFDVGDDGVGWWMGLFASWLILMETNRGLFVCR